MKSSFIVLSWWVGVAFVGCKGGADGHVQGDVVAPEVTETVGDPDTALSSDTGATTVIDARDGAEAGTAEEVGGDVVIQPGELGAPCESPNDCNSGWCLAGLDGYVCSRSCEESCPLGWECRQNLASLPDIAYTCMPPYPTFCRPCRSNADCLVSYDGTAHACVPTGDGGAFCGALCADEADCPADAFCASVFDIAGNTVSQCQPQSGVCGCSAPAIAARAETRCAIGTVYGHCGGTRHCAEGGLTECDARVPARDECNGADDNCDGATDEAFVAVPCFAESGAGHCEGETRCEGALGVVCSAPSPGRERCGGGDEDCDGAIDDEGALDCTPTYLDQDGDTHGIGLARCLCAPEGFYRATIGDDCDDTLRKVVPGGVESCNGVDDDCDGATDEAGALGCRAYHRDGDDDGFGDPDATQCTCAPATPFDTLDGTDCDDALSGVNRGSAEACNARDDDCDGQTDEAGASGCVVYFTDVDGDTYGSTTKFACLCAPGAPYVTTVSGDCDDGDRDTNPRAPEACDGHDDDCDGATDELGASGCEPYFRDQDGDHYGLNGDQRCLCAPGAPYVGEVGGDCNDQSAAAYPDAEEVCDGVDNDCDQVVDEAGTGDCTVFYEDRDLDGHGVPGSQACLCGPAFPHTAGTTDDCDDQNPFVSPSAPEGCNRLDDNCNGDTDEGVEGLCTPFYHDADSDGWGDDRDAICTCAPDAEHTTTRGGDCDDTRIDIHPLADELCGNDEDDDCDGTTDGAGALGCLRLFADRDGDSAGDLLDLACLCAPTAPYTALVAGDCDDTEAEVRPHADEACNLRDDDCDGATDEAGADGCGVFLRDQDDDQYGLALDSLCLCAADDTYRAVWPGDCNDRQLAQNPGASEVCDGLDNDCNGVVDDPGLAGCFTFYRDVDGDTWGVAGEGNSQCLCAPQGTLSAGRIGDCADLVGSTNPAAPERCNGVDDDCDDATDEPGAIGCTNFLRDDDGDGFGIAGDTSCLCAPDATYRSTLPGDCDDEDDERNFGEAERCDGKDNDCDTVVDPPGVVDCVVRYQDHDGDQVGDLETGECLCAAPEAGEVLVAGDCDDEDPEAKPSATEACNGKDDDCDGQRDEAGATSCTTSYLDADGDHIGVEGSPLCLCSPQAAYSATVVGDCDDGDGRRTPGKPERCNGIDDDCDLTVDEEDAIGCSGFWRDEDGDSWGVEGSERCQCGAGGEGGLWTATRAGDCNDAADVVNPDEGEVCDSLDNDCDGVTDESQCGLPTANWPTFMHDTRRTGHALPFDGPIAANTPRRWKVALGHAAGVNIESSPIIDESGNVVIVVGEWVYKRAGGDGATLWEAQLPAAAYARAGVTARVGGTYVVPTGNGLRLLAVDGTTIWTALFSDGAGDQVIGTPIVDANGNIFVVSNQRLRKVEPTLGSVVWSVEFEAGLARPAHPSDPAIGPDGRIYFATSRYVHAVRATTIAGIESAMVTWSYCPLSGAACNATKLPRASVTMDEIGRILVPFGNALYLLNDATTSATVANGTPVSFVTGGLAAEVWANAPLFSDAATSNNPSEYPGATTAGTTGYRSVNSAVTGTDWTVAFNKRAAAHGAAIFDRDGDIFVGSDASAPGGQATFYAIKNRSAAAGVRGTVLWSVTVDGSNIDQAAALGIIGAAHVVVFGDSTGNLYCYGN